MKMILTLLAIAATSSQAKIGETPEQCAKRYGTLVDKSQTGSSQTFVKDGIETRLAFEGGKCIVARYQPIFLETAANLERGKEPRFTKENALALLKLNSGGAEWIQTEKSGFGEAFDGQYQTKDGKLHARVNFTGVSIETTESHRRDMERTKPEELTKTIESFK